MSKIRPVFAIVTSFVLLGALALLAATLLLTHGAPRPLANAASGAISPPAASVIIPRGQDLFSPFIQTIQAHSPLTWQNDDMLAHTLTTTWDTSTFLNPQPFSYTIGAGKSLTLRFEVPGLYQYFDQAMASWDQIHHRVVAHKGVPNYPLAMEGIIYVQGPIVSRLPFSGFNTIPAGMDDFQSDFIAIMHGGSVTWHNKDTDLHVVSTVPGWSAPVNARPLGVIQVPGTDAKPGGGSISVPFAIPGLYYYYCAAHASINTTWNRVQAHSDASLYPIPMEGFVLVF